MVSTTTPRKDELITAATADLARGFHSVRLVPGKKRPRDRGWNTLRMGAADLEGAFEDGDNRGRLLGVSLTAQSGVEGYGVCVDLDCDEAIALAPAILPVTGERGGRHGAPTSHWFYASDAPLRTLRLSGPDKARYVELLGEGAQVVVPPSVHPSGERYVWDEEGTASRLGASALRQATVDLAIGTLCLRCCTPDAVTEVIAALPDPRRERVGASLAGRLWVPVSPQEPAALAAHVRAWLALR